ncbi:complex III assembly factor LYRM7 [Eurytemora carolleeae]|uniref:complex III assembly factor LYRM7 n=1 Tax=Eurytemora carolleeae TaxID=1294199 RepID=UPI000C778FA8|nr:complex III assembly factor LYRM7 [Eurytemora carolleeae]|eukprot:XP_023323575.1 complex III assembly factor LYRM7-like [Eurytemora affinis]
MSKREVLKLYKGLHRTVQSVFKGDIPAMCAARDKICDEFNKNRKVSSETSISELVNHGREVNQILRETVIQIKKVDTERYQMKIREETHMFENNPFREDITEEEYKNANRRKRKSGVCEESPSQQKK